MREYFSTRTVPDNAWLGVSVEDRKYGKPRIHDLRLIDARTRFLSVEPLLEDLGNLELNDIHWVIVGGESGAGARPMEKSWVVNIRRQCRKARVPFFFKQWGGVRNRQRGRELDGQTYDEFPQIERGCVPDAATRKQLVASFAGAWPLAPTLPQRQTA